MTQKWITVAVSTLLVFAIVAWAQRARDEAEASGEYENRIEYPRRIRRLVLGLWGLVAGFFVFLAFWMGERLWEEPWAFLALVALFAALMLPVDLEVRRMRVSWDEEYLYSRSPWRRARKIPLSDVLRVDYSHAMQWHRLHTRFHGIVRVHVFAAGLEALLFELDRRGVPMGPAR